MTKSTTIGLAEPLPRAAYLGGLAIAVGGAILFSTKAVLAKLLYRYQLDAVTLIAFRMMFSVPVFAAVALWKMRSEAPLSRPVQVLGLTAVPKAGDNFLVVTDDRMARQIAERREARERTAQFAQRRRRVTLEDLESALKAGEREELLLIIKGDVSGSVEALEDSLLKLDVGEEVNLRVIGRGVGAITQDDVNLAIASEAVIIGFNVRPAGRACELAQREGVDIRYYSIIYQAIEEIEAALKGMLKPEFEEAKLGTAEVRELFKVPKIGTVAGCIVRSGTITRNSKARLIRDSVVISDNLTVESLRRFKDDATEVREGFECGIGIGYNDIRLADVIETFEMREKPRA